MKSSRTPKRLPAGAELLDAGGLDSPPFPGFSREGFRFLRDIKKNNDRAWMTPERKRIYTDHLQLPMQLLLEELRQRFEEENLPFAPDARKGIFRLHRDTRFSKDKKPYKTHIGAAIPIRGEGKEGLGNYLHIEPGGCFYGGGAYFIEGPGLHALRAAIDRDPSELREILAELREEYGELEGEQLKRNPTGYPIDHPAIDLLKYKQMWMSKTFPDELATSRDLVDWIVIRTRELTRFNLYLHGVIRGIAAG
jgi:uncharacterized protein (TIGR02453 family)